MSGRDTPLHPCCHSFHRLSLSLLSHPIESHALSLLSQSNVASEVVPVPTDLGLMLINCFANKIHRLAGCLLGQ
jgi:hypothetical protein